MKKWISLLLFLSGTAMAAPNYIAQITIEPGFVFPPRTQNIYLLKNHRALLQSRNQNNQIVQSFYISTLGNHAFTNASKRVAAVHSNSPLVDLNPSEPFCTDVPRITVMVVQGDHLVQTYKNQNCHESALQDHSADSINLVMRGLAELRDF